MDPQRVAVAALGVLLALGAGCKKDGGDGGADAGNGGCPPTQYPCASGCCDCPEPDVASAVTLVEGGGVGVFAGGDLDGDGRMDVALARNTGGVLVFYAARCGGLTPGPTGLDAVQATGLAVADVDGTGVHSLVALGTDHVLYALAGTDLTMRWSATVPTAGPTGRIVAAKLDGDADQDVAAFDQMLGYLALVDDSAMAWTPVAPAPLPAAMLYASAGDLGDGPRDELLLTGSGGFYELVSTGDLAYTDMRTVNAGAHGPAAVADFDGSGTPDVLVVSDGMLLRYSGDGATNLAYVETFDVPTANSGIDLVPMERDGAPPAEAALLQNGGGMFVVSAAGGALGVVTQAMANASARRIFAGDLDGDGRDDVVALGLDGVATIWRTP